MEELDLIKQETMDELDESLNQHENEVVPEDLLLEVKEEPSLLEVNQDQDQDEEEEQEQEQEQDQDQDQDQELEQEQEQEQDQDQEQEQVQEQKQEQEQEQEQEGVAVTGGGGERWPGWPGESVFRILVPSQKVGGLIGRKGEYIKKIVEESKARIKVLDGPPGITERAVMISAREEPESSHPPAIDGLLRVHRRVVDGLENDSSHPPPTVAGKVSTKLLVPASQAGSLIGKQGTTVKSIQEASSCIVRVLGTEDLPMFALQDDRIVEVVGEPIGVHKAVELIASHLRKFLVDRGIIPVFEMQMQMPPNPPAEHMPPPQTWGPPPQAFPQSAAGGPGYGNSPHFMPPSRQHDNYYPPADMPPPMEKQPHQGISAYGREAPMSMHSSSNNPAAPSLITQITQQMQIPLAFADAVIGTNGASISYIRRVSGATVTIQETKGVPGEMTVEINGTASQVQTAQQLIQNFMADAGAPQPQTGPPADQGYNPYGAPPPSMYSSAPSNAGVPGQSGGYGSMYGNNYGY